MKVWPLLLVFAGCQPLVGDLDLQRPSLSVQPIAAGLIGAGAEVQVELRGCTKGNLRFSLSGTELSTRSFGNCFERCDFSETVTAVDLIEAVGLSSFAEAERQPELRVEGTCQDFDQPIGPVTRSFEMSPFSAAARIPEAPESLAVRPHVESSGRALLGLHAATAAGLRMLGYLDEPDATGPLSDTWFLWRARQERLVRLLSLEDLVLGYVTCQTAGCALPSALIAADYNRKLRSVISPEWPGFRVEGLIASSTSAWALVSDGSRGQLAAIEIERAPTEIVLRGGRVLADSVDWRASDASNVAYGLDPSGQLFVAVAGQGGLRRRAVENLSRPIDRISVVRTDAERRWLMLSTSREAEPRFVVVDLADATVRSEEPVIEGVTNFRPTRDGFWALERNSVRRYVNEQAGPSTSFPDTFIQDAISLADDSLVVVVEDDATIGLRRFVWLHDGGSTVLLDRLHTADSPEASITVSAARYGRSLFSATPRLVFRIDVPSVSAVE